MKLRTKLVLAFTMVACVPLVGGAIGIYSHRAAVRHAERGSDDARRAAEVMRWVAAVEAGLDGARPGNPAVDSARMAEAEKSLTRLVELAGDWKAAGSVVAAIGTASGALTDPSRRPAVSELATFSLTEAASLLKPDGERFAAESRVLDLIMGVGTLAGIGLGIAFGAITSFAVTRHIRSIAGQVFEKTATVAASVTEVAGASRDLAHASSQQAAALEETHSALIEVNTIVAANASRAHDARAISHENRAESDRSAGEVADLQAAMKEMSAASASIAKIVRSIDEIAFQTNILALNAAVEAARAGPAGAGFAVVADEVRNLAQRSATAARETSHQIGDALAKSTRGAELAARVEVSLRKVIEDTHRVDTLIGCIADSSGEQAQGLDQAVNSMRRIDQLTQSNTASAEHVAGVAEKLDEETKAMRAHLSGLTDGAASQADGYDVAAPWAAGGTSAPAVSRAVDSRPRPGTCPGKPSHGGMKAAPVPAAC